MYQDFRSERELLAKLFTHISQYRTDCVEKYAPEFAIALQACLSDLGIPSQLISIGRTTFGHEQHEISSSSIAHIVVRCFGADWDAGGIDAERRFIERWFDFPEERTTFTRSLETVDSLDELCTVHCAPMKAGALSAIHQALSQAWNELHTHGVAERQPEILIDVPL